LGPEPSSFYDEMRQDLPVIQAGFVADQDGHLDCAVANLELVEEQHGCLFCYGVVVVLVL
jgi:hypothetical protein